MPIEDSSTMNRVRRIIETFTGEVNRETKEEPEEWISRYLYSAQIEGWSTEDCLKRVGTHLSGKAWTWFSQLPEDNRSSITKLKGAFMARFAPTENSRHLNIQTWNHAKLEPGETIEDFVDRLRRLARLLGKNEQDVMDQVYHGLPESIKSAVVMQRPKDIQDMITVTRLALSTSTTKSVNFAETDPMSALISRLEDMTRSHEKEVMALSSKFDAVSNRLINLEDKVRQPRSSSRERSRSGDRYNNSRYRNARSQNSYSQSNQNRQLCTRCQKGTHPRSKCRFIDAVCHNCQTRGHIADACFRKGKARFTNDGSR